MVRFLIVDDSATVRLQLKEILIKLGVPGQEIDVAVDGAEAVQKFHQLQPEVVFMDITMPNQDGVMTTHVLLQLKPELKVVVVTGQRRDAPDSIKLVSGGAYAFIEKPIEMEDVRRVLKKLEMGEGGSGRIMSSGP